MSLMDESEQLLKALKPVIAMREDWFSYAEDLPVIFGLQVSAQRIDYLLGATVAAYEYAIQNLEGDADIDLTEWHFRYESTNSELVSFYNPAMHCWKMNELIVKLCFESKRTGQKIRATLQHELLLKQLEMCRMMVNYSIEGDIWSRTFGAALSLIELIDLDEDSHENLDEDLALKLTYMAESSCLRFWDNEGEDEFVFPRFRDVEFDQRTLLTLYGVGVDVCLRAEGLLPLKFKKSPILVALYDSHTGEVESIRYETTSGWFHREGGFWWNFGGREEEFFDEFEMIYVRPEFVEVFDKRNRFNIHEITPYALSYEELYPNE